jgi:predicted nucleotidyltransferase
MFVLSRSFGVSRLPRLPRGGQIGELTACGFVDKAKRPGTPYDVRVDREVALLRLAELLPTVRKRFGVRDLAVFGSVARGEASATSDLDVLVDFEGPATFDGFMGLKSFLEDTLGVKVDLVTRAALNPRLRARVESEARRVA